MRKIRQLLLMAGLIGFLPVAAQAQWATSRIEHDWRVTINGDSYGLTQDFFSTWSTIHGTRTTTMYFGQDAFRTRLPAVWVAALALAFVGAAALALFAMLPGKHEYGPPNCDEDCGGEERGRMGVIKTVGRFQAVHLSWSVKTVETVRKSPRAADLGGLVDGGR